MKTVFECKRWLHLQVGHHHKVTASNRSRAISSSLATHAAFLLVLALLPRIEPSFQSHLSALVLEDWEALAEPLEFEDQLADLQPSSELLDQIGAMSEGVMEEAAPPPIGETLNTDSTYPNPATTFGVVDGETFMNLFPDDGKEWISDLTGIPGVTVHAHGDVGSVKRITLEILKQLEESKVLVVWLMDASDSLRGRREEIIGHFDRVYEELETVIDLDQQLLLTHVAAFGERLVPMLKKPTSDRAAIRQAVRSIERDESGVENVCSAIQAMTSASGNYIRQGRKLMIVVVTDEKGDDLQALDETILLLKRWQASIFVMGPSAPFGREQIRVNWIDSDSGEAFLLPVDRGPETARIEHAELFLWNGGPGSGILSSGFGPFGLTRITYENGGLYLLQEDGALSGSLFAPEAMSRYRPDYFPLSEYSSRAAKHPLRAAVRRTAQACNQLLDQQMRMTFFAAGIQFGIRDTSRTLKRVMEVLARGLQELELVAKNRSKETAPRWQAHYDLLIGRLLANQARCYSAGQLLEAMYLTPRQPSDGINNAWQLVRSKTPYSDQDISDQDISDQDISDQDISKKGNSKKGNSANRKPEANEFESWAMQARDYLQRVIHEHPETPWSAIARRELEYQFTFQWQATFIDPPEGVALPWDNIPWEKLTAAQKEAKAKYDNRLMRRRERKSMPTEPVPRSPPRL